MVSKLLTAMTVGSLGKAAWLVLTGILDDSSALDAAGRCG